MAWVKLVSQLCFFYSMPWAEPQHKNRTKKFEELAVYSRSLTLPMRCLGAQFFLTRKRRCGDLMRGRAVGHHHHHLCLSCKRNPERRWAEQPSLELSEEGEKSRVKALTTPMSFLIIWYKLFCLLSLTEWSRSVQLVIKLFIHFVIIKMNP